MTETKLYKDDEMDLDIDSEGLLVIDYVGLGEYGQDFFHTLSPSQTKCVFENMKLHYKKVEKEEADV